MAGYDRTWMCRICHADQRSVDTPKNQLCDDCVKPIAKLLCKKSLGVSLDTEGVDLSYWMRLAEDTVAPMMRRWAGWPGGPRS